MIRTNIEKNHLQFEKRIEEILNYASNLVHDIPQYRRVQASEKALILESLILRACAFWESFLENELVLCAHSDQSRIKTTMNILQRGKLPKELIRALIFSDRYLDLHDIHRIKSVFKRFTSDGFNPISKISSAQTRKITFTYSMRNYLSHYSAFSRRAFQARLVKDYQVSKFTEPGKFLLSGNGERFNDLISHLKFASINMRNYWR